MLVVTPYQMHGFSPLIVQGPKDKSYETKEWEFAVIDVRSAFLNQHYTYVQIYTCSLTPFRWTTQASARC